MIAQPASRSRQDDLRLAAIDLDGTLLGSDHRIGEANRRAVAKLIAAGMEVVLASGRHYLAMLPYAQQLPGVRWLVSAQGGEVSDVARLQILDRRFLTPDQVADVIALLAKRETSAVYYAPEGVFTDSSPDEALEYYATLSSNRLHQISTAELKDLPIFKVVAASSPAGIDALVASTDLPTLDVQTVRTHHRFFEFMPSGVTKATALETLAKHLALTAQNAVAFGDGDNDVPMFQWAGRSLAMPHGWPNAKANAQQVGPAGDPDSAFARAIDCIF